MLETTESILDTRKRLLSSFIDFCKVFYKLTTAREFLISNPISREPVQVQLCRIFTDVFLGRQRDVVISVPPGSGKSTICSLFVAWTLARYPDSQYLYLSYAHTLSAKHTEFIKRVISLREYQAIFDVHLRADSRAKDFFQVTDGGSVKAFGTSGSVTGQDGGLPNVSRFSGVIIIDDAHKPDEVHSDVTRLKVIDNFKETILQRARSELVPIVYIGQRLHEDDLPAYLLSDKSERVFTEYKMQALDAAGNALYPEVNSKESLLIKKQKSPYVYSSQYQQEPIPAGGALFKIDDFVILDTDPDDILATFITCDTAETDKTYNDATVFSFWGIYKVKQSSHDLDVYALHWLDCSEIRVEPRDLEREFFSFYQDCLNHPVHPQFAAVEKKSTGVTLVSVLKDMRGLRVREIERTRASGSKTERYLSMQPYIASKLISLTASAKHRHKCVTHMSKITANDTHKHDDICDTAYDAVKLALIDKVISIDRDDSDTNKVKELASSFRARSRAIR